MRIIHSDRHHLLSEVSSLAREWHPERNSGLSPDKVTLMSGRKVWWRCLKGHEWQATIAHRNQRTGCPYCEERAVCDDNCLETVNSQLAKEWHPNGNGELSSRNVTAGSNRKVWWRCQGGHEWQATIANRSQGTACPLCEGITD